MKPDVDEKGLADALLLARDWLCLSSLLTGRAIWYMSFNLWPSKPPIMYMILLKMIERWKVLGWGYSWPTASTFVHLRWSMSN